RARGRFVLATNVDLLFPDALFAELRRGLDAGVIYRNDRLDVSREIPGEGHIDQLLAFCEAHVIRVHRDRGTYVRVGEQWKNTSPSALSICAGSVRRALDRQFGHWPGYRAVAAPVLAGLLRHRPAQTLLMLAAATGHCMPGRRTQLRANRRATTRERF